MATKQQGPVGVLLLLQVFILISLILMGYCCANIIHFYIEDIYNQPTQWSYFFGKDYAQNTSILLVDLIVFLILQFSQWHLMKKAPGFLKNPDRKKLLVAGIVVMSLISVGYIIGTISSFFSGMSDPIGLLRVLFTLVMLCLGILYCYCAVRPQIEESTVYRMLLIGAAVCIVVVGVGLAMIQASPAHMREVRADQKRAEWVSKIAGKVEKYYAQKGHLPESIDTLVKIGMLVDTTPPLLQRTN